jgi:uncharacterized protein
MKIGIAAVLLAILAVCPAMSQWAQRNDSPFITVSGEAMVYAKPDKIEIALGIATSDMDIIIAKRQNDEIFKKTIAAIKRMGIAEKEIQTDQLSIEPKPKRNYQRNEDVIYYDVTNRMAIVLMDTNKAEELIMKTLQAGVNNVYRVDFQTTEYKKYREQARELALKAAQEKAEKMAAALGQSIGAPFAIREGSYSAGSLNSIRDDRGPYGDISGTLALGKISIRASVTVDFELKRGPQAAKK